jgi:tetratricopeptide (TPR) repeat protein
MRHRQHQEEFPVKILKLGITICCLTAVVGCAAIFGRSTNDPAVKLQWASEHFSSKDEPVQAEELIREAIANYKKTDNQLGLAEAYRQYGLFFRSNAVNKFEKYYRTEGFEDKTVKFDQRFQKAVEYFNKSRELYADYGHIDIVSNLYISLGKTYDLMNRQEAACEAFNKGLDDYAEYKKINPEAMEFRSEEMQNYVEYIGILKKQAGCQDRPEVKAQAADVKGSRSEVNALRSDEKTPASDDNGQGQK